VLIVRLLQKLKGFGDMKNSIPSPDAGETCKTNLKNKKDISRRWRREPKRINYVQ